MYFAKERELVVRGDSLISLENNAQLQPDEQPQPVMSRMRSLGCTHCTGAIRSEADTVSENPLTSSLTSGAPNVRTGSSITTAKARWN